MYMSTSSPHKSLVFVLTYLWLKLALEGTRLTVSRLSMSSRSFSRESPTNPCVNTHTHRVGHVMLLVRHVMLLVGHVMQLVCHVILLVCHVMLLVCHVMQLVCHMIVCHVMQLVCHAMFKITPTLWVYMCTRQALTSARKALCCSLLSEHATSASGPGVCGRGGGRHTQTHRDSDPPPPALNPCGTALHSPMQILY